MDSRGAPTNTVTAVRASACPHVYKTHPLGYKHNLLGMNGRSLRPRNLFLKLITVIFSLIPLLSVKILHLVDGTDLFKISNLDLGGKTVVTSLYSSLESTETERERERENQ